VKTQSVDHADGAELLDGSVISVRLLGEGDIDAIVELHEHLTDRERYMRFFVVHPAYMRTFAQRVVECDKGHCGLGAFDSGSLIGVASYAVSDDPDVAEVAVAVAHRDHLRGVATALLRRLGKIAVSNGIHTFAADVLAGNAAMLKVLSDAGWQYTKQFDGSVSKIRIDLSQFSDPNRR
jgi:RimJ/RimL family protein N-acetyltransferase